MRNVIGNQPIRLSGSLARPNNRLQGMRGLACFRARTALRAGPAPLTLGALGGSSSFPTSYMRCVRLALVVAAIIAPLALSSRASAQTASPPIPGVEELMTAAEFRASGLSKLTPAELTALNAWLSRFARAVTEVSNGAPAAAEAPAVVESRIDGEFQGWDGETIFRLQNGQIWQQSTYAYKYSYKYSPKVVIYRSGAGYRMQVEGVDGTIGVRRLR
jgi:hypothetical protein